MEPVYSLENVQQVYEGRAVVDVEHLQVGRAEVLGIVGPSGAGKSTLLRLLAFLERPTSGSIHYDGRLLDDTWPDLETRRQVTMVFQRAILLKGTVMDNVAYGLGLRNMANGDGRIARIVEQLGLTSLSDAPAQKLSGGEMQRVALARAMVLRPNVLLLDEPTSNLDPYNIQLIEQMVGRANKRHGVTVVIVTHNIFQARRMADRVGLMLNGRLVEVSDTEVFFEKPRAKETAAFVRGEMVY